MQREEQFLVFGIQGLRLALPLSLVRRVVRAVWVTPLPDAPPGIRGVINVAGQVLPVVDLCPRLQRPVAEIQPSDYLILVDHPAGRMALLVNEVLWIISRKQEEITPAQQIFPGLSHIQGVIKMAQDIILIHDLEPLDLSGLVPEPLAVAP